MAQMDRTSDLFGLLPGRNSREIIPVRHNHTLIAFTVQLVPIDRLFAPVFAALPKGNSGRFLMAFIGRLIS